MTRFFVGRYLRMIVQLVIFEVIFSLAGGCRLQEICETVPSETVDPFVTELPVTTQCSGPDASSSMWYIRRYQNGINSLDCLGDLLTLNDSFRQVGNQLEILNVTGFAEGTYHCGVDINNIQSASLCLFVRGQPVFVSCPGEFEVCPSVTNVAASENGNVSLDTRIEFVDGGFCKLTKRIRFLIVTKDGERVYLCSNLTTFSDQLCEDNDMFGVELQQSCTPPDIALCKYNMKLVFHNFDESDEGTYNVEVTFEDDQFGRGTLTRQFNLSIGMCPSPTAPADGGVTFTGNSVADTANYSCDSGFELIGSTSATCMQSSFLFEPAPPICRLLVAVDDDGPGLSSGAIAGIVFTVIIGLLILICITVFSTLYIPRAVIKWRDSKFFKAALKGDHATVTEMINRGIDVNSVNKKGESALGIASGKGDVETTRLLLEMGARVDSAHFECASSRGFIEVVELLLAYGSNLDLKKALKLAAEARCQNIVKKIEQAPRIIHTKSPCMLAVTNDRIIIIGESGREVNMYSKELIKVKYFTLEGDYPLKPRGVATDGNFIFITDKGRNRSTISKYDFNGRFVNSVGMRGCRGIAVAMQKIYIANLKYNRIDVLDLNLKLFFSFGSDGSNAGELDGPHDVAVSKNGRTVYVSDSCNNRVLVFSAEGKYIRKFGNDILEYPVGICIDSSDNVLIADTHNHRVCVFNSEGVYLGHFGERGSKRGKFESVYGVAVDNDGTVYTSDRDGDRVQIFPPNYYSS